MSDTDATALCWVPLATAIMSGMPIVTTATCGMKGVIQDGRNGLLVPIRSLKAIEETVERLIASPAIRVCIGRASQAGAVEKYTWQRVAELVRAVYEHLWNQRIQ